MRVDMSSGAQRYAVCVASYGYMGDLMRASERLRCLGPARYGLAGAWTLLRGAAYDAEVCRHIPGLCAEACPLHGLECARCGGPVLVRVHLQQAQIYQEATPCPKSFGWGLMVSALA